jgi:hypothetical protein
MDEILSDGVSLERLGNEIGLKSIIERNVRAPCCNNSHAYLKSIDEYIDDVYKFDLEFGTTPATNGYQYVINGMKNSNIYMVESVAQLLKKFDNEPNIFNKNTVASFDETFNSEFAEDIQDLSCANCRYDVALFTGKKYEFKSFGLNAINNIPSNLSFNPNHALEN